MPAAKSIKRPRHGPSGRRSAYHYDFRMEIAGRLLYIETVLIEDDPEDSIVHVVSIHDA